MKNFTGQAERGERGAIIVDDPVEAFLHRCRSKVDQQTNGQVEELERGQNLFHVNRRQDFN